jgi:hypothetical protein
MARPRHRRPCCSVTAQRQPAGRPRRSTPRSWPVREAALAEQDADQAKVRKVLLVLDTGSSAPRRARLMGGLSHEQLSAGRAATDAI